MNYTDFLKILYAGLRTGFILVALIGPVQGHTMSNPSMHQAHIDTPIVRRIHISRNRAFSNGELKALMSTRASPWYDFRPWSKPRRYDAATFGVDLDRLRDHYRDRGYLEAKVDSIIEYISADNADKIDLKIFITEGPLTRVSMVWVMGLGSESDKGVENSLGQLVGKPLSRVLISRGVSQTVSALRNKGHAFARSEVDTTSGLQPELVLKFAPGPVCSVRAIHIAGNKAVSNKTILRGLTFQENDQFSEKALQNSQFQLYRARVFQSISVTERRVSGNQVDVNVRVSERPFIVLRLDAGYDTDEGLWTSGAWTHRNFLFGGARQLQLSGRISGQNRETVLGLRQPYFFSTRNWLNISGFLQRTRQATFERDEVGGNLSLERNFTTDSDLIIQFSSGMVDFSADSAFVEMKVGLLIDTRDNIFDPQSGLLTQFTVRERGRFFKAESEFLQTIAEGRGFLRLPMRSVLALRVQGGLIFELGKTGSVPNIERFFAGGINSVRGWGFNALGPKDHQGEPTGGLSHAEMSLEIRTKIFRSWGTTIFVDAGNVDASLDAFNPRSLKYAVGIGLRYFSLIGPLRFDVGYRLSEDMTAGNRVQYHMSLGQAF